MLERDQFIEVSQAYPTCTVARGFQHLPRRDQFNITPEGIVHKPTDAAFIPSPRRSPKRNLETGLPWSSTSQRR
jgi:hypothetical protein